jgi:hypothetical protein
VRLVPVLGRAALGRGGLTAEGGGPLLLNPFPRGAGVDGVGGLGEAPSSPR